MKLDRRLEILDLRTGILILFLIISYLTSQVCTAQDNAAALPPLDSYSAIAKKDTIKPKRYFVGASIAYAHLLGNIIGVTYVDPTSGFINPNGYNTGLEGAYYLTKRFAIGGLLSFQSHYVSRLGLDSLAHGYQRDYNGDSATAETSTRYNFFNLLVGPYYAYPLKNKKTYIDFRLLGGLSYVRTAEFDIIVINMGVPHPFAQNISQGVGLAAQGGIALRHDMGTNVCIKIGADCYYSDLNIKIKNSNMPTDVRQLTNYHQPVFSLLFSFGIYYKFGL
jgi:hypothetical protein